MLFLDRIKRSIPIAVTTVLALLLLIYVGYGEALQTAPNFEKAKLRAQGEIIQNAAEVFLQAGLPVEQFSGVDQMTASIMTADQTISAISIRTIDGSAIFQNSRRASEGAPLQLVQQVIKAGKDGQITDGSDGDHFRILLPLRNKFETVAVLELETPSDILVQNITMRFVEAAPVLGAIAFGVFLFAFWHVGRADPKAWVEEVVFGFGFLTAAALVTGLIVQTYAAGIESKTRAMADSLAQRLSAVSALGLEFEDFEGLDKMIADYRKLNPEIKSIAVTFDNTIKFHTNSALTGGAWQPDPEAFEYSAHLSEGNAAAQVQVSVAIPREEVYYAVLGNIKTFGSLFIATGFMAILFIQLTSTLQHPAAKSTGAEKQNDAYGDFMLELIKPVYFIGVFVEALNASFLPQHLKGIVTAQGLSESTTATVFMVFFLSFALVLIPAGQFAERKGPKPLLIIGAVMSALAQVVLAQTYDLNSAIFARALSGAGQGLFLIGIQSFILQYASPEKKTQGAAIIVYGFNGGMISGSAIGSLLSVYMGISGVFMSAFVIGGVLFFYVMMLVPVRDKAVATVKQVAKKGNVLLETLHDILALIKDIEFLKTMVLVGIPTKAVLTGVTIYALPLLLAQLDYENDSIGQIIMFYAAGVLISSHFVSRIVDRIKKTVIVLLIGCLLSGVGLALIGAIGFDLDQTGIIFANRDAVLVLMGMSVLGLAHGFINAPVVTHIGDTPAAARVGKAPTNATYKFLERIGHVTGPIIVAALLFAMDGNPATLLYIGGAIVVMGLLFSIPTGGNKPTAQAAE